MTGVDLFPLARLVLGLMEPEQAHTATLKALSLGLGPRQKKADPVSLSQTIWGLTFTNPVGIAAGFDKNGEVPDAMMAMGFGFAEVGTVTPLPQAGNAKPRVFRLADQAAVINRLGFNNQGHGALKARLEARQDRGGILGVNIGANKDSADRIADYEKGIEAFEGLASYFTVNISSPNTPGLRALQSVDELRSLVGRVLAVRKGTTPVLLKIAPDLTPEEVADIAQVATEMKLDGIIVSNTTIMRQGFVTGPLAHETGGLSGRPLFGLSTAVLRDIYRQTKGQLPLIGVGGISSGADAYAKIRAGASLVQLYSALTYQGPDLVTRIKDDLERLLREDGFAHINQAVGIDSGL